MSQKKSKKIKNSAEHITRISAKSSRENKKPEIEIKPAKDKKAPAKSETTKPTKEIKGAEPAKAKKAEKAEKTDKKAEKLAKKEAKMAKKTEKLLKKSEKSSKKSAKSPKTAKTTEVSSEEVEKKYWLKHPFKAFGNYIRNSWKEIRQVRWPNRKATWKMTFAVLAYCAIMMIFILLLDLLFTWVFDLLFK